MFAETRKKHSNELILVQRSRWLLTDFLTVESPPRVIKSNKKIN